MNHRLRRLAVATTAVALGMGGLTAASAATTDVPIRQADLLTAASDTRANGKVEFLAEGLHVQTGTNTATSGPANNKAAEYWESDIALADAGEPSFVWYGTDTRPGMQLVVDLNADGTADGILVGEPKFYSNRWWANNSLNAFIGSDEGNTAPGPADGYQHSGPLDDWRAAYPEAQVLAAGFSLGSGVTGDGVLRSLTVGESRYVFTSEAEPEPPLPVEDVTATAEVTRSGTTVKVKVTANATPEGSAEGEPAQIQVLQGPKGGALANRGKGVVHAGESYVYIATVAAGNAQRVQVTINGEKAGAVQIP